MADEWRRYEAQKQLLWRMLQNGKLTQKQYQQRIKKLAGKLNL